MREIFDRVSIQKEMGSGRGSIVCRSMANGMMPLGEMGQGRERSTGVCWSEEVFPGHVKSATSGALALEINPTILHLRPKAQLATGSSGRGGQGEWLPYVAKWNRWVGWWHSIAV